MASRKYARKNILQSGQFLITVADVAQTIDLKTAWALIGGLAISHYANPPVTIDIDILVDEEAIELDEFTEMMENCGWKSRPLFFPNNMRGMPKTGTAFKRGHPPVIVDALFTGSDKFLRGAIKRSRQINLATGLSIPVLNPEDLIIMKSMTGREKDHEDVADMYEVMGDALDTKYIRRTLERLE